MRALVLIGLVGTAACGDNTGLVLTISAPAGPPAVDRIEIVLANPDAIKTVQGQVGGGEVSYYRQKSTAGRIAGKDIPKLDGFQLRIEGRDGKGDEPFVPFVIAYDANGHPVAAGAVPDAQGQPLKVDVPSGSRLEATVSMTPPLILADPTQGLGRGQITEISCAPDQGGWRSGVAWQPMNSGQIRLLFPDPDGESALDATGRSLDLDCDGFAADARDCDDVRARFNPAAPEECDGVDMNCDGAPFAVTTCPLTNPTCGVGTVDGVQLCRDVPGGGKIGDCEDRPACRCQSGNPGPCQKCVLEFEGQTLPVKPCAPGVGLLMLAGRSCTPQTPCTVDVVQEEGPWLASVGSGSPPVFERRTTTVMNGVLLRVKLELPALPAGPGASVGAVHLAVSGGGAPPAYLGIDLELSGSRTDSCASIGTPSGNFNMTCSQ